MDVGNVAILGEKLADFNFRGAEGKVPHIHFGVAHIYLLSAKTSLLDRLAWPRTPGLKNITEYEDPPDELPN
jgi:hypothetical protein